MSLKPQTVNICGHMVSIWFEEGEPTSRPYTIKKDYEEPGWYWHTVKGIHGGGPYQTATAAQQHAINEIDG